MKKDYRWSFDLTNGLDDNLIFLSEQGVDIIKNPDGTFKFEKPCWIEGGIDPCTNVVGNWKCSVCHGTSLKDSAFCPNCGAKME